MRAFEPMRCSALLLAALASICLEASADGSVKSASSSKHSATVVQVKKEKKESDHEGKVASLPVTEEQLTGRDLAPTTTKIDFHKIIGPVIGTVVGAGALAGVIAISAMKTTTTVPGAGAPVQPAAAPAAAAPSPAVFVAKVTRLDTEVKAGATKVGVVNQAGFQVGDEIVLDKGTQIEEANHIQAFGSLVFQTPLKFTHPAGAEIETVPQPATPAPAPAPAFMAKNAAPGAPLAIGNATAGSTSSNSSGEGTTMVAMGGAALGLCLVCLCAIGLFTMMNKKTKRKKSPPSEAYTPYLEDQSLLRSPADQLNESQYMPVLQNVGGMESQYMPVNTPGIGNMPTLDVVPMQTMPPTMFNGMSSPYLQASPLAQTQNAMAPTMTYPPTIYG